MRRRRRGDGARTAVLVIVVAAAMWPGREARAVDLRGVLTDHTITSWSQEDGLPAGTVWAIVQDETGYVWIGSDAGLLRFDGTRFVRWDALGSPALPDAGVRAICLARDGTLWVGFDGSGGIAHIRGARARHYRDEAGLARGTVRAILEDRDGTIWAGSDAGLFRLGDDRWTKWMPRPGLPESSVFSAYLDRQGRLLVGTPDGILRKRADADEFVRVDDPAADAAHDVAFDRQPRSIIEGPFGEIYTTDLLTGFRTVSHAKGLSSREHARGYRLLYDKRGNLWVGTLGQGLWRARPSIGDGSIEVQKATTLTGLLSDEVMSLAEDAEGNIWAGTRQGLNRLRPRKFRQLSNLGLTVGVEMTPDGDVWIGTVEELLRFSPERPESPAFRLPLGLPQLKAMYADERGVLWLATDRGLARLTRHDTVVPLEGGGDLRDVDLMTADFEGGLWVRDVRKGLFRWRAGRLERAVHDAAPSDVSLLHTDSQGRVWVGISDGRLGFAQGGEAVRFVSHDEFKHAGGYRRMYEDRDGVLWVAAAEGLGRFKDGRLDAISKMDGFPLTNLTALIDDEAGNLWIGTRLGIVRLAKREYEAAVASEPRAAIRFTTYTRTDGLPDSPISYNGSRHVVRGRDHSLWFLASAGVTLIDPQQFNQSGPMPVKIEYALADDARVLAAPNLVLPPQTSRLAIVYRTEGPSPIPNRFRYRLEGFDTEWVQAGTRRQASYVSLPPRTYRFSVVSGTDDGAWADDAAVWEFTIKPRFHQTLWFYGGLVGLAGTATWALWQARMRAVRRRFSLLIAERARLSRELHDTLLQSLVGTALQLDVIAADVEPLSPVVHRRFVRVRKRVEEYVREARQSIWELRTPTLDRGDLAKALPEVCRHALSGFEIAFDFEVTGAPGRSALQVEEQLLRIGREAVTNVVQHARARRVAMTLHYAPATLALTVVDDGCGFDMAALAEQPGDHYGLLGMQERAREVGGSLKIASRVGVGTEIRATVPRAES